MTIGKRLKEERERLGFSQPDFSAIAGTTKKSQIDYEKNITQPKAGYLAAVSGVGVDVAYVITGVRSVTPSAQTSEPLNREEEVLLDNFRHCSAKERAAIKATSDALAQQHVNKDKLVG